MEEEDKRYYEIQAVLEQHGAMMLTAISAIAAEEVSKYPIFVVHQQQVEIGVPLIDRSEAPDGWSIHVSTLEEFAQRQIIEMDKVDNFIQLYKSKKDQFCVFVLSEVGAKFIFLPH